MKGNKLFIFAVIFVLIAESVLTGLIPHSRGYLFGLLESKVGPIYLAIGIYFCNYLILDAFQAIKPRLVIGLSLIYRVFRTESIRPNPNTENAPQRLQEDVKLSYESRLTVWCEYFISTTIVIQLLAINLSQPILLISALTYAALSVYIAYKFNPRLTTAEKEVQKQEASYRAQLSKNITNITGVVQANKASIMAANVRLQYSLFTKLQLGLISILPYIVLVPALLAGDISLGGLMKHQATFALIVVNAAILIQYYPLLIRGKASEERVKEMEN